MNREMIMQAWQPRKLANQVEFDKMMHDINDEQTRANHPLLDRDRDLSRQREQLFTQINAMKVQLNAIKMSRLELEQQKKEINRAYHEVKHKFIELNPVGGYE